MALPESVEAAAAGIPLPEDIVLGILRDVIPELHFTSLIDQDCPTPFVLVRGVVSPGRFGVDERFQHEVFFTCESFTSGLDGDRDGGVILNAVVRRLYEAALRNTPVYDGLGWLNEVELISAPARKSDWATSEGPVQYADLPSDYVRYICTFRALVKRSKVGPNVYSV